MKWEGHTVVKESLAPGTKNATQLRGVSPCTKQGRTPLNPHLPSFTLVDRWTAAYTITQLMCVYPPLGAVMLETEVKSTDEKASRLTTWGSLLRWYRLRVNLLQGATTVMDLWPKPPPTIRERVKKRRSKVVEAKFERFLARYFSEPEMDVGVPLWAGEPGSRVPRSASLERLKKEGIANYINDEGDGKTRIAVTKQPSSLDAEAVSRDWDEVAGDLKAACSTIVSQLGGSGK